MAFVTMYVKRDGSVETSGFVGNEVVDVHSVAGVYKIVADHGMKVTSHSGPSELYLETVSWSDTPDDWEAERWEADDEAGAAYLRGDIDVYGNR